MGKSTSIKITNGFVGANKNEIILTGVIIQGNINKYDLLILTNGVELIIQDVEFHNIAAIQQNFAITILEKTSIKVNWSQLYGTELKIRHK